VTTGKSGYDTPQGHYQLWPSGRVYNETMTSSQAAIDDPAEAYNVKNVLYTQYFTGQGDALHLNYWQPEWVFGAQPTSHGCVGLMLHDAQWLWLFVQSGTMLNIHA
jgi:lipoprotein-anchoring transpeptidase ErfK/SrfK